MFNLVLWAILSNVGIVSVYDNMSNIQQQQQFRSGCNIDDDNTFDL